VLVSANWAEWQVSTQVVAPSPLREKAGMRGDIMCDFILLSQPYPAGEGAA